MNKIIDECRCVDLFMIDKAFAQLSVFTPPRAFCDQGIAGTSSAVIHLQVVF